MKPGKKGIPVMGIIISGLAMAAVLAACRPGKTESGENSAGSGEAVSEEAADGTGKDVDGTEKDAIAVKDEIKWEKIDFESLKERNSDIYAWITVPGTGIDYPVVQRMDSEDLYDNFYLDHTVDLVEGYPGAIYSQPVNDTDFMDPVNVLYGHNMKDGSMFGCLHDYADRDYFDKNHIVVVYTENNTFVYEIFAAVDFSDDLLTYEYDFSRKEEIRRYLEDIKKCEGNFREDVTITEADKILTLSTCYNTEDTGRFLVEAVLVEEIGG